VLLYKGKCDIYTARGIWSVLEQLGDSGLKYILFSAYNSIIMSSIVTTEAKDSYSVAI
jgi:hypothetical protein